MMNRICILIFTALGISFSGYSHIKYGSCTFLLNGSLEICGAVYKTGLHSAVTKMEGSFSGLQVRTSVDLGSGNETGTRYMLKWETLPANRDQARPEPWPEPGQLYLFKLVK